MIAPNAIIGGDRVCRIHHDLLTTDHGMKVRGARGKKINKKSRRRQTCRTSKTKEWKRKHKRSPKFTGIPHNRLPLASQNQTQGTCHILVSPAKIKFSTLTIYINHTQWVNPYSFSSILHSVTSPSLGLLHFLSAGKRIAP
jgi:hypothetical protein